MSLNSERIKLGDGIHLNLIKSNKFKANILSYYFIRPLTSDEVTKNALIPLVLKRGTKRYGTTLEIEKQLEDLYGADFSVSVNKKGERHILRFSMEWAGDYFSSNKSTFEVLDLLHELIFDPCTNGNSFNKRYVDQEKKNLKNRIEAKINNKRSYAINRCIEEMCKTEKFSLYQLGYVEDLEHINEKNLYQHYKNVLETSPIEIFYAGKFDDEIVEHIKKINNHPRKDVIEIPREKIVEKSENKNMIDEKMDVNQGKLVMGYRIGIPFEDDLYDALLVASDIFGGGPNSKLFMNVREKESLAYYSGSSVFKFKSIMIVDSGIDFINYDKSVDIINEQLDLLKKGEFTQEDINISKKSMKTSINSIRDSLFLISEFFFSQILTKDYRSIEEVMEDIDNVKKNQIIEAANRITLDTIYFMNKKN